MKNTLNRLLKWAAISAAVSIAPLAFAGEEPPAPPEAPQSPREVIIFRPDAPEITFSADDADFEHAPTKMEKVAYLGVGVESAPEVLTDQLKLPRGVGLVVEFIEKGSPAETAGLQARDLLQKLDDQLLINPPQLATLVRTFKPKDSVKLTVLRRGEVVALTATLVEKEMPALSSSMHSFSFNTEAPLSDIAGQRLPLRFVTDKDAHVGIIDGADNASHNTRARVIRVMPGSSSRIINVEDGLRIELETKDGIKSLHVQDGEGKSLFDGPFNTPEEIEKLPATLREKVKAVEEGIEVKEVPATSPAQPKADAHSIFGGGPAT